MSTRTKLLIAIFLVLLGVLGRTLPHLWNFTPLIAIALFAGTYLGIRYAVAISTTTMLLGDFLIGFYDVRLVFVVYASIAISGLLGAFLRTNKNPLLLAGASVSSSILFFLTTNFAVWAFSSWYPHTFSGLLYVYTLAIPFFRNAFLGDLFYTFMLFGAFEAARYGVRKFQLAQQVS